VTKVSGFPLSSPPPYESPLLLLRASCSLLRFPLQISRRRPVCCWSPVPCSDSCPLLKSTSHLQRAAFLSSTICAFFSYCRTLFLQIAPIVPRSGYLPSSSYFSFGSAVDCPVIEEIESPVSVPVCRSCFSGGSNILLPPQS